MRPKSSTTPDAVVPNVRQSAAKLSLTDILFCQKGNGLIPIVDHLKKIFNQPWVSCRKSCWQQPPILDLPQAPQPRSLPWHSPQPNEASPGPGWSPGAAQNALDEYGMINYTEVS